MMWVLISVSLNAVAQIFLKKFSSHNIDIHSLGIKQFFEVNLILAALCYLTSIATWITALKTVKLSHAYPMQSLGYVLVAVLSVSIFGEKITYTFAFGLATIILGVVIMGWGIK